MATGDHVSSFAPVEVAVKMPSRFSYLVDETALAARLKTPVKFPIRLFTLKQLGIDQQGFLETFQDSFDGLPWDLYDTKIRQVNFLTRCLPQQEERLCDFFSVYYAGHKDLSAISDLFGQLSPKQQAAFECIQPQRKRSTARFVIVPHGTQWRIERVSAGGFSQKVGSQDYRAERRVFAETAERITSHGYFFELLARLADIVGGIEVQLQRLVITFHQVSIVARPDLPGDNSPEGIHQDGADYIVSALVVERRGVVGGETMIFGPDKEKPYLHVALEPGQAMFQADAPSPYWHYVTPVYVDARMPILEGRRSIFGFDIDVVK